MTDSRDAQRTDLACGSRAFFVWYIPTAVLAATAFLNIPFREVIWPVGLTWMGGACLWNARRCGRRHCYVTGPFFLVLALVSLLYGFGVLHLGSKGWPTLAWILLLGSCALTCLPEWIWGKYRNRPRLPSLKRP